MSPFHTRVAPAVPSLFVIQGRNRGARFDLAATQGASLQDLRRYIGI